MCNKKVKMLLVTLVVAQLIPVITYAQALSPQETVIKLAKAYEMADDETFYQLCATQWRTKVSFEWVSEYNKRCRERGIKQLPPWFPIIPEETKISIITDTAAIVDVASQQTYGDLEERHIRMKYALIRENNEWKVANPYGNAIPIWWGEQTADEKEIEAVMTVFSNALLAGNYAKMYELTEPSSPEVPSLAQYQERFKKRHSIVKDHVSLEQVVTVGKPQFWGQLGGPVEQASINIVYAIRSSRGIPMLGIIRLRLRKTAQGWKVLEEL